MQPPTEPAPAAGRPVARGDEEELYRRHHRDLHGAVAHVVRAPRELIEDACQTAWAILLRNQPERYAIFAWLRVVAIHEAYRLLAIDRRDGRLDRLRREDGDWHETIADPRSLNDAVAGFEALRVLAALPERPTHRPRAQRRRIQLRRDPGDDRRTRADRPEQVVGQGEGSHPSDPPTRLLNDATRGGQITPSPLL
jgi:hypothetical protein